MFQPNTDKLKQQVQKSNPGLPSDFFPLLLGDQLSRDVLGRLGNPASWEIPKCERKGTYHWLSLKRLPIPPGKADSYDLLGRWQSVLSAAHTMDCSTALALIREQGQTSLYLGAYRNGENGQSPAERLSRAARVHMPGMVLQEMSEMGSDPVSDTLERLDYTGLVTGLPSNRLRQEGKENLIQTLDKLTYGVTDSLGLEQDYAVVILAKPAPDREIAKLTNTLLQLRSDIHKYIAQNISIGANSGTSVSLSLDLGAIMEGLMMAAGATAGSAGGPMGTAAGAVAGKKAAKGIDAIIAGIGGSFGKSWGSSYGASLEEKDFVAAYCDELIQKHVNRLQNGRSLGFWNTGIYVASRDEETVEMVLGMLRSIYAGPDSYLEPIRVFNTGNSPAVQSYMRNLNLLPLPGTLQARKEMSDYFGTKLDHWHVFGPLYEYFSTPMTTEEFALATNLPRRDVPGLRFVHNAVKLTANPPELPKNCRRIRLGTVIDMGMPTGMDYALNVDSLVRHVLNDGITGYGKSTTTFTILNGLARYQIPWLIIEPVKTDYVEWAMDYNRSHPNDKIAIYMPGFDSFYGEQLEIMQFNPFQPCAPKGARLNLQGHLDALASLLTASVSMGEVLPLLMKEALQELANSTLGVDEKGRYLAGSNQADPAQITEYPKFSQLLKIIQALMDRRGYAAENHQNISAALETRVKSLLAGWRQDFFDAPQSTSGEELFGRKVIVNLIGIEADEDKAFFMSLILRALSEYRSASYYYLSDYRNNMKNGDRLMHFTVVEEAHRLLSAPTAGYAGEANPQGATASMFSNMLREIRKFGEGLMIVDQQPSHLIPDALKNTDLKIIHKMPAEDDRRAVGACMGLNQEQMDLIAVLQKGEAIISSSHDDAALWVKVKKTEY